MIIAENALDYLHKFWRTGTKGAGFGLPYIATHTILHRGVSGSLGCLWRGMKRRNENIIIASANIPDFRKRVIGRSGMTA
jgi:hypothetical protein